MTVGLGHRPEETLPRLPPPGSRVTGKALRRRNVSAYGRFMERRPEGLISFSWLEIGGGMAVCAAFFAVLLVLSGPFSTTFEVGVESLIAGFAVAGFFVFLLGGLTRLLHLNSLTGGLWMTFLALACLVGSFLPPISFYGSANRGSRPEYVAFAVFSGGWYMLIMSIVMLSAARKGRRQGRPPNTPTS
jgi:hypothetical protein